MTTNAKHSEFNLEQKCLKDAWHSCCDKVKEFKSETVDAQNQLTSSHNRNNENYGLIPVLNRKIREASSKINYYELAKRKLYFGKLVITEDNSKKSFYIGPKKVDLEDLTIYSYNAPFASMYYSRENKYHLQNGKPKFVDLQLVRNLDVDHDVLIEIYDTFIKDIGEQHDEISNFLHKQLDRLGEDRFKEIYVTLQKEQNEIIRMPDNKHLIIQGGAGTGKTIVLLYRLAYLMHNNEWSSEDVLLISPSSLFLNYLKVILPDMELSTINQKSLHEINVDLIKKSQDMEWAPSMVEVESKERGVASDAIDFKCSSSYKALVDERLKRLIRKYSQNIKDFSYRVEGEKKQFSAKEIKKWFFKDLSKYPVAKRKNIIRGRLKESLASLTGTSLSGQRGGQQVFTPQQIESMLGEYFKEWPDIKKTIFRDFVSWYFSMLDKFDLIGKSLINAHTKISENVQSWNSYFSLFSLNDLAVLFYASIKLIGYEITFKHIVIDEAQLLSPIWFEALAMLLDEKASMTITGDINQKPEEIDIYDWDDLDDVIGKTVVRELSISYRLTDEIAKVALDILYSFDIQKKSYKFESAGRVGASIQKVSGDFNYKISKIMEVLSDEKNYKTFAIITKTHKDAKKVYDFLKSDEVALVTKVDSPMANYSIIPVSLVGGMEFDVVAIIGFDSYNLQDEYEARALYIAVTRAVHKLIQA